MMAGHARDGARGGRAAAGGGRARRPRARRRGRCSSGCSPAASAAPTCTSPTASWPTRSCRWCSAIRSSARWSGRGGGRALRARRSRRDPLARLGVRRVPVLPLRPREPLRARASSPATRVDGGYAELAIADERFCLPLPADAGAETAPLLCAGMIGYRALRMCGDAERLGLYGFGASAHLVCQVAVHQGRRVFAVTRAGRRRQARVRARARRRVGGGRRRAARAARRRDHLRAGG